jgi:hypothetical protein
MTYELTIDGRTLVYDLDACGAHRISLAKGLFGYYEEIKMNMPKTWRDYEMTGALDSDLRGIAYLFFEYTPDGKVPPFDKRAYDKYVEIMKGIQSWEILEQLEACRAHFFTKAKLRSAESRKRLTQLISVLAEAKSERKTTTSDGDGNKPSENSDASNSTTPENSSAD